MNEPRPESEMKHCDINQQKREESYDCDLVVDVATRPRGGMWAINPTPTFFGKLGQYDLPRQLPKTM